MGRLVFDLKNINYISKGQGDLLIILPGNTASSIAYKTQIDLFSKFFFVVSIDYLGTGKSDRISDIKDNWWKFSATQVSSLIDHLGYERAIIIGSSGGAVVAMHLAAEFSEKVSRLILDSFSSIFTKDMLTNNVINARSNPNDMQKQFWFNCHGNDWESVISYDTENIKRIVDTGGDWLLDSPKRINCPVLLLGSKKDEFIPDIECEFKMLTSEIQDCRYILSLSGSHPLIWTNTDFFNKELLNFISTKPDR